MEHHISVRKENDYFPKSTPSNLQELDAILLKKLEEAFLKESSRAFLHNIARIANDHSSIDLAYIAGHLPPNLHPVLYEYLPNIEAKINFLTHTDSDTRTNLFRFMKTFELKNVIETMPIDEAVWILDDISERRFKKIMEIIDAKRAIEICKLRELDRKSAGRLMKSDYFAFKMNLTIGEIASYIQAHPNVDFTNGIFVIDDFGELMGEVIARDLVINGPETTLKQVMQPISHKVLSSATREEVIDLVERYNISSLAVVNEKNHLIGVITSEDVVEAMEDLTDETLASISGTGEVLTSYDPVLKRFVSRAPWLVITLFAGLVNVSIMSIFENYQNGLLTFILFFVPLITGMSGNIGLQSSTVLVRSMALGNITISNRKEAILKELFSGLFTGFVFGFFCGFLVYVINYFTGEALHTDPIAIAVIVSSGLIGACSVGTLLGIGSPLFFSRIGVDPAISSGPILTALNDFLSMTIYFLIAWILGGFFFN